MNRSEILVDGAGTAVVLDSDDRFWFRLPGGDQHWHRLSPPPVAAVAAAPATPPPGGPRRRLTWRRVVALARLVRIRVRRVLSRRPAPQAG